MISSIFMLACQPRVPSLPQIDSVQPATLDQTTKIGSTVAPAKRSDVTVIEVWIGTDSGRKWAEFRELGAGFMEKYPKIEIRFVPIAEGELSKRMETAQAANVLPDIVWGGAERVFSFAADDIVDEYAVEEVINNVGTADFKERILNLLANADTGRHIAIPFYGWVQAIWYRQDLFEKAGLAAPTNWEAIIAACEVLPNTNGIEYGITLGTDPTQNYPHQFSADYGKLQDKQLDAYLSHTGKNITANTHRPQMLYSINGECHLCERLCFSRWHYRLHSGDSSKFAK